MSESENDLVRRVHGWARQRAADEGWTLPAPAAPRLLAETEQRLGFALHPLLRRVYTEVADGGFGPDGWRLFPLERLVPGPGPRPGPGPDPVAGEPRDWPEQVVAVMGVGCAMVSAVDCRDPAGQVLVMDPNSCHSREPEAWSLDVPSLDAWLEGWLDGTSWLLEEAQDPMWPEPWQDAAVRLAQ